jgi:leader peptidase (prepilin peptidase)/N-methyltransferase
MLIALLIISPFIGSFAGLLATRLPERRNVLTGRSVCGTCNHTLTAVDLVPILSWTFLKGRCRYCGASLGFFYPAVEIAALLLTLWAATQTTGLALAASCVFGWILLTLALSDWLYFVLPNALTLVLLVTGLAASYGLDREALPGHVVAAVAGFLVFAAIDLVYRALRGRVGLGLGDAKLMAGIGAWLGWQGFPTVVVLAGALGLLLVLSRSLVGKGVTATDRLPFGAFLAAAAWIVWLYGPLLPS